MLNKESFLSVPTDQLTNHSNNPAASGVGSTWLYLAYFFKYTTVVLLNNHIQLVKGVGGLLVFTSYYRATEQSSIALCRLVGEMYSCDHSRDLPGLLGPSGASTCSDHFFTSNSGPACFMFPIGIYKIMNQTYFQPERRIQIKSDFYYLYSQPGNGHFYRENLSLSMIKGFMN